MLEGINHSMTNGRLAKKLTLLYYYLLLMTSKRGPSILACKLSFTILHMQELL